MPIGTKFAVFLSPQRPENIQVAEILQYNTGTGTGMYGTLCFGPLQNLLKIKSMQFYIIHVCDFMYMGRYMTATSRYPPSVMFKALQRSYTTQIT